MSSALAEALLRELDEQALADLAERLRPFLVDGQPPAHEDGWLGVREAAEYLGISTHALHRLTAARQVPFSQDRLGARCYFRRSELDRWRQERARGAR